MSQPRITKDGEESELKHALTRALEVLVERIVLGQMKSEQEALHFVSQVVTPWISDYPVKVKVEAIIASDPTRFGHDELRVEVTFDPCTYIVDAPGPAAGKEPLLFEPGSMPMPVERMVERKTWGPRCLSGRRLMNRAAQGSLPINTGPPPPPPPPPPTDHHRGLGNDAFAALMRARREKRSS